MTHDQHDNRNDEEFLDWLSSHYTLMVGVAISGMAGMAITCLFLLTWFWR